MADALRCSACDVSWPTTGNFKRCPLCHADTWKEGKADPLNHQEADALVREHQERVRKYEAFQAFLAERDHERDEAFAAIVDGLK